MAPLHRHGVFREPKSLPERPAYVITDEHIQPNSLDVLPNILQQPLDRRSAKSLASCAPCYEELPQVDRFPLTPVQRVADNGPVPLHENRPVVAGQPGPHPLLELVNRHRVAMPLIPDQVAVQMGEEPAVIDGSGSKARSGQMLTLPRGPCRHLCQAAAPCHSADTPLSRTITARSARPRFRSFPAPSRGTPASSPRAHHVWLQDGRSRIHCHIGINPTTPC
jgi:hypothetical protein